MADGITFNDLWEMLKSESPENRKMLEEVEAKASAMMADELISRGERRSEDA